MKFLEPKKILSFLMIWAFLAGSLTGCGPAIPASDQVQNTASYGSDQIEDTPSYGSDAPAADVTEDLVVHFLDIGQGDCIVLTQGEHAMLIDAGENDKGTAVQSYLNYLGVDTLEYVILTHPDSDHIGGADVILYKFACETILMPDKETDTRTYDDVIQAMKSKGYTAEHPQVGDTYSFGEASFTVLSPSRTYSDNNNNSIVIRLTHGENTFLFTGDAEEEAENEMLEQGLDLSADVLKAGHHGSSTSTSDAFLEAVSPSCAVISCGEDNKYGHPHAETMNKFRQAGITVYRTDEQGTITAASDGTSLTWNTSPSDSWLTGEPTGSAAGNGTSDGTSTDNETSDEASADSKTPAGSAPAGVSDNTVYILNNHTMKFHLPDCPSAADIAPSNREESALSREELIGAGYDPCGRCNP